MRDPKTRDEWYEAVNAAAFFLLLNDCKLYGLIEGGPHVDVSRCEEILEQGRNQKIPVYPMNPSVLVNRYIGRKVSG